MCKKTKPQQNENHNEDKGDNMIINRKNATISIINEANNLMKNNSPQEDLCCYKIIMFLSVLAFVILNIIAISVKLFRITQTNHLIFAIFCLITESLLFVWWMKFLSKLLSDARESMKAWQTKVTDTCGFLIDMETLLYKAEVEKEKKAIGNTEGGTSSALDQETNVESTVKKTIETMMEDKRKECTEVGWVVRLKDTEPK